jgi:hypothetical protein
MFSVLSEGDTELSSKQEKQPLRDSGRTLKVDGRESWAMTAASLWRGTRKDRID